MQKKASFSTTGAVEFFFISRLIDSFSRRLYEGRSSFSATASDGLSSTGIILTMLQDTSIGCGCCWYICFSSPKKVFGVSVVGVYDVPMAAMHSATICSSVCQDAHHRRVSTHLSTKSYGCSPLRIRVSCSWALGISVVYSWNLARKASASTSHDRKVSAGSQASHLRA